MKKQPDLRRVGVRAQEHFEKKQAEKPSGESAKKLGETLKTAKFCL